MEAKTNVDVSVTQRGGKKHSNMNIEKKLSFAGFL